MKSHMMARFEGVCAHLPFRALDGIDPEGVRSGSGNSWGCPRVETIFSRLNIAMANDRKYRLNSCSLTSSCCDVKLKDCSLRLNCTDLLITTRQPITTRKLKRHRRKALQTLWHFASWRNKHSGGNVNVTSRPAY